MTTGGKTRLAVRDALNGDFDKVDPALRRALFAISTELDEHSDTSALAHAEIMEALKAGDQAVLSELLRLEKGVKALRALLVSTTVTFVIALGTGLLNLLIN